MATASDSLSAKREDEVDRNLALLDYGLLFFAIFFAGLPALVAVAIAYAREGRLQEALAQFQEVLRVKPDYPDALNNLGNVLGQTGRPKEAIKQYEQALRLNPNSPEVYNNLGFVLTQTGQLQEAIKQYKEAVKKRR